MKRIPGMFVCVQGVLEGMKLIGHDFFADKNVSSIVLEVPNANFGSANVKLWARVADGSTGSWIQAHRDASFARTVPGRGR
jgi:hypothetical protein